MATTCAVCGKRGATDLCMGCGAHIHAKCAVEVRGVKYCTKCKGTAHEFEETVAQPSYGLDAETHAPPRKYQAFDTSEEGKWEKSFDSSTMVEVTKKDLKQKATAIDLSGAYAGLGRRIVGHLLDIALVLFPGIIVGFVILGEGTDPLSQFYDNLLFDDFLASLCVTLTIAYALLFVERVLLNSFGGVTLGRLFVGTKIVDTQGHPAGIVRGTFRAILSTFLDLFVVLGWILYLLTAASSKTGQALHDKMAGTVLVIGSAWKKACTEAIMAGARESAGVTPPKKAAAATDKATGAAAGSPGAAKGAAKGTKPRPKPKETPPAPSREQAPASEPPQEPAPAEEELPGEDEILSPFATYDEAYEPTAPEERDPDAYGVQRGEEEGDGGGEENDEDPSTDLDDPWNR